MILGLPGNFMYTCFSCPCKSCKPCLIHAAVFFKIHISIQLFSFFFCNKLYSVFALKYVLKWNTFPLFVCRKQIGISRSKQIKLRRRKSSWWKMTVVTKPHAFCKLLLGLDWILNQYRKASDRTDYFSVTKTREKITKKQKLWFPSIGTPLPKMKTTLIYGSILNIR